LVIRQRPAVDQPCSATSRTSRSACATRYAQFDIGKVLERLLLKGSIVVKKAYCDWERYKEFKAACTRRPSS
jgi:hypothetical protein